MSNISFQENLETKSDESQENNLIQAPKSLTYDILKKRHCEYDTNHITRLNLLYEGGNTLLHNARSFLKSLPNENPTVFKCRCESASYKNVFAQIINDFNANLFCKSFNVIPSADSADTETSGTDIDLGGDNFYKNFFNNCDNLGTTLSDFLKDEISKEAMVAKKAYIGIDLPKIEDVTVITAPQQIEIGAKNAYLYTIPNHCVIDWGYDSDGNYSHLRIENRFSKPHTWFQTSNKDIIEYKQWYKADKNTVKYAIYRLEIDKEKEPQDKDIFNLVEDEYITAPIIPIICHELPYELWVGNLIENLVIDHFNLNSSLNFAVNKAMFPTYLFKKGPEISSPDTSVSETQQDPNRDITAYNDLKSKGYVVAGSGDELSIVEPKGDSYKLTVELLKEKEKDIHAVVNQMGENASSEKSAKQLSGLSKVMDNHNKQLALTAFANKIKHTTIKIYDFVGMMRQDPKIFWQFVGMNDFKQIDRDSLINEAKSIKDIQIHSKTFNKKYEQCVASELLTDLSSNDELIIKQEIDEAYEQADEDNFVIKSEAEKAKELQNIKGNKSSNESTNSNSVDSTNNEKQLDKQGNTLSSDTNHLSASTSNAGITMTVYNMLLEDYRKKDLEWIKGPQWEGPIVVPLTSIDFSNMQNWMAYHDQEHVDDFKEIIQEQGQIHKPIVLVNEPNDNKYIIVDGHHRALAAFQSNVDPIAYVAHVGAVGGPWEKLHDKQKSTDGGLLMSQQKSNQKEQY